MIVCSENYKALPVGTKAANLFKMQENGFNIPPFFCVFGDSADEAENFAKSFFNRSDTVSVRSSSSAEDGADASFAGQFQTELNVPQSEISTVVSRVCRVPKSAGFTEYCKTRKIAADKISVCAVVQKMIAADLSGVIFTANPQGILNESVVVVGRGTGNNVVEDKTSVTTYYFNGSDGSCYSEREDDSPTISEDTLNDLIRSSQRIKELFGESGEYDIEFAIKDGEIFFLQARPITTLRKTDSPIVLDNSNIVESYPGITLPLTQSFIRTAYYRVFRSVLLRLTHEPKTVAAADDILRNMVDAANGRIYYRISNWYDVILFLPFNKKIIPVWQEMLGVKNKNVTSHLENKIGFWTHTKVTFTFINLILTCPKRMEKLSAEFVEMIRFFKSVDLNKAKCGEILAHYKNLLDKVTEKWDLTLVNDMYSFIFTGLLKSRLKARGVSDYEAEANRQISGINGLESMKPVTELIKLAKAAKDSGELPALKKIKTRGEYYAYHGALSDSIAEYIENYGDRNAEELKLESKTFRTDPQFLVWKIVQYAENETADIKPAERSVMLKGLCGVFAKKAACGIKNREKSRLDRSRLYGMMRSMVLKIGEEFAAKGQIAAPRDIFYLEYDEIEKAVRNKEDMRCLVERRKELYKRFELLPAYSRLVFADKVFDRAPKNIGGMETSTSADVIKGVACSNGKVRGEVLVVDDPSECPDTAGKIIVAKMTDPGWVFLIVGAAGIIVEKGSLLSHTAIISRELGKPSVVGADNAARLLKSGDVVELDGTGGTITIISRCEK